MESKPLCFFKHPTYQFYHLASELVDAGTKHKNKIKKITFKAKILKYNCKLTEVGFFKKKFL